MGAASSGYAWTNPSRKRVRSLSKNRNPHSGGPGPPPTSMGRDDRQLDEAGLIRSAIHALRCLAIVPRLSEENVVDEGLRVAVVKREPAGLDLHHDAVTRQEHVIRVWQREAIGLQVVGGNRAGMLKSVAITSTRSEERRGGKACGDGMR